MAYLVQRLCLSFPIVMCDESDRKDGVISMTSSYQDQISESRALLALLVSHLDLYNVLHEVVDAQKRQPRTP